MWLAEFAGLKPIMYANDTGAVEISYEDLLAELDRLITPAQKHQVLLLNQALHKVNAKAVYAPMDWPNAPISAMDGYAFNWQTAQNLVDLTVEDGVSWTGDQRKLALNQSACRISTGALMPLDADTVITQEQALIEAGVLKYLDKIKQGAHVKPIGSDLAKGQLLIQAGERLKPRHLALLASVGIDKVEVKADLKILLLNTGNEVIEPGEKHIEGKTYNANRYGLTAYIQAVFGWVCDSQNLADDPTQIKQALVDYADQYDLIITTGGSSVGSRDYIRQVLPKLGESYHWHVQMKPAKPLSLGKINQAWLLALPGNPVAAMVSMLLFGRRVICRLLAANACEFDLPYCEVTADFSWFKPDNKMHWLLVSCCSVAGQTRLQLHEQQGSSHLLSLTQAQGWVKLAAGQEVKPGDKVRFIAFDQLGL
ncbi:MAG: molybdopterin molybdotransferase MoeA [Thiomicrospira sp.]|uniref:molybdopterin molybdotransferase MoeA n=1 Tax=Thiomicrospira sp. TaxID=935 RepID=UPI0019EB7067|nr:molybdopterin molybdotransferase MoeA [Thiomicrospira sp.]MBE0494338.1 molybdopterin molybdotransferase MoeA [Thiomicrospira sp.]